VREQVLMIRHQGQRGRDQRLVCGEGHRSDP
jgi:hypothetical protein